MRELIFLQSSNLRLLYTRSRSYNHNGQAVSKYQMDRDHSLLGGIIVRMKRHLVRPFEIRCSEIQVTDHIFINKFFS